MGLFHKQTTDQSVDLDQEKEFFDKNFREELRNHGRWYFEKVIDENGSLFKQELDATVAEISTDMKAHVTAQVDTSMAQLKTELQAQVASQLKAQLTTFTESMAKAQADTLQSLTNSVDGLQEQYRRLGQELRSTVSEQESLFHKSLEDSRSHIAELGETQERAVRTIESSVLMLQQQQQQLGAALQQEILAQKTALITLFQDNMAQVIEHYLLEAVSDQYDLAAQMPAIIKQLETHKQAMVDDISL